MSFVSRHILSACLSSEYVTRDKRHTESVTRDIRSVTRGVRDKRPVMTFMRECDKRHTERPRHILSVCLSSHTHLSRTPLVTNTLVCET